MMASLPPIHGRAYRPQGQGQHVVLSTGQYNHLVQQLDRLSHTQKEQKETIHQLVNRLHSLEQVIDGQRNVISQFPSAPGVALAGQFASDPQQFWASHALSQHNAMNATPSVGYSLANDFATAHELNGLSAQQKPFPHPATSIMSSTSPNESMQYDLSRAQEQSREQEHDDEEHDADMERDHGHIDFFEAGDVHMNNFNASNEMGSYERLPPFI